MAASRRVTIRDVAERAGVSISTVSHALSAARPISEPTRQRVLEAADELGYQANAVASSLRRGRTQLLGFILRPRDAIRGTKRGTHNFLQLIGSIATTALDDGWGVVHIPNDADTYAAELPVDGYIVAHPYVDDRVLESVRRRRAPLVVIDPVDPDPDDWTVEVSYTSSVIQLLGKHSFRNGVLLMPGTEQNLWNREVTRAVSQWCDERGTPLLIHPVYEGTGARGAVEAFRTIEEAGSFDAIITGPSAFALGLNSLDATRHMQIAAITDSPSAQSGGITAVDIRLDVAGAAAVELLTARLTGAERPSPVLSPTEIRWRESWRNEPRGGGA